MYFVTKDIRQHASFKGMSVTGFYNSHSADGEDIESFIDILVGIRSHAANRILRARGHSRSEVLKSGGVLNKGRL
jgi:hypothetical protein